MSGTGGGGSPLPVVVFVDRGKDGQGCRSPPSPAELGKSLGVRDVRMASIFDGDVAVVVSSRPGYWTGRGGSLACALGKEQEGGLRKSSRRASKMLAASRASETGEGAAVEEEEEEGERITRVSLFRQRKMSVITYEELERKLRDAESRRRKRDRALLDAQQYVKLVDNRKMYKTIKYKFQKDADGKSILPVVDAVKAGQWRCPFVFPSVEEKSNPKQADGKENEGLGRGKEREGKGELVVRKPVIGVEVGGANKYCEVCKCKYSESYEVHCESTRHKTLKVNDTASNEQLMQLSQKLAEGQAPPRPIPTPPLQPPPQANPTEDPSRLSHEPILFPKN